MEYESSIIKSDDGDYFLFTKGDPLEIQDLCVVNSLTYNYTKTISKYSLKGYKCTAMAFKQIKERDINLD